LLTWLLQELEKNHKRLFREKDLIEKSEEQFAELEFNIANSAVCSRTHAHFFPRIPVPFFTWILLMTVIGSPG